MSPLNEYLIYLVMSVCQIINWVNIAKNLFNTCDLSTCSINWQLADNFLVVLDSNWCILPPFMGGNRLGSVCLFVN